MWSADDNMSIPSPGAHQSPRATPGYYRPSDPGQSGTVPMQNAPSSITDDSLSGATPESSRFRQEGSVGRRHSYVSPIAPNGPGGFDIPEMSPIAPSGSARIDVSDMPPITASGPGFDMSGGVPGLCPTTETAETGGAVEDTGPAPWIGGQEWDRGLGKHCGPRFQAYDEALKFQENLFDAPPSMTNGQKDVFQFTGEFPAIVYETHLDGIFETGRPIDYPDRVTVEPSPPGPPRPRLPRGHRPPPLDLTVRNQAGESALDHRAFYWQPMADPTEEA